MFRDNDLFLYVFGLVFGFLLGLFIMYIGFVKGSIILPEKDYDCKQADILETDSSKTICSIFVRKSILERIQ